MVSFSFHVVVGLSISYLNAIILSIVEQIMLYTYETTW